MKKELELNQVSSKLKEAEEEEENKRNCDAEDMKKLEAKLREAKLDLCKKKEDRQYLEKDISLTKEDIGRKDVHLKGLVTQRENLNNRKKQLDQYADELEKDFAEKNETLSREKSKKIEENFELSSRIEANEKAFESLNVKKSDLIEGKLSIESTLGEIQSKKNIVQDDLAALDQQLNVANNELAQMTHDNLQAD